MSLIVVRATFPLARRNRPSTTQTTHGRTVPNASAEGGDAYEVMVQWVGNNPMSPLEVVCREPALCLTMIFGPPCRRLEAASVKQPVVNDTGLDGIFNLKLVWMPAKDHPRSDGPPSLPTAIAEHLGLRLVSETRSVPVLVIDHAEKPGEN
jgi:uncharacterized protein (TIGR03435 family)